MCLGSTRKLSVLLKRGGGVVNKVVHTFIPMSLLGTEERVFFSLVCLVQGYANERK